MSLLEQVFGPSWRTSLGGMAVIGLALTEAIVGLIHGKEVNWPDLGVHVAAGTALMTARDNQVTSAQVEASRKAS